MGWFDFLMGPSGKDGSSGPPGKDGAYIESATSDASGKMKLTMSDGNKYYVDLPAGPIGPVGATIAGVSFDNDGFLILQMSDKTEVKTGANRSLFKGDQGSPGIPDTPAVIAALKDNNAFITSLGTSIARDSTNLSSNVVNAIKADDTLRNSISTTLGADLEFKKAMGEVLSSGDYKLAFKGDPGTVTDFNSLKGSFGWKTPPVITKSINDKNGILENPNTESGTLKTLWCADGVKRYGDSITSTICTAPGPLNLHFTNKYAGVGENDITAAEISNDTTTDAYKKLMLVGNKSSGKRTVGVYDNLDVEGDLAVKGPKLTLGDSSLSDTGYYVNLYKKDGPSAKGFAAQTLHSWGDINAPSGTVTAANVNVGTGGGVNIGTNRISNDGDDELKWSRITRADDPTKKAGLVTDAIDTKDIYTGTITANKLMLGDSSLSDTGYYVNLYKKDGSSAKGFAAQTLHSWGNINAPEGTVTAANVNAGRSVNIGGDRIENGGDDYWRLLDNKAPVGETVVNGKGFAAKNLFAANEVYAGNSILTPGKVTANSIKIGDWTIIDTGDKYLKFTNGIRTIQFEPTRDDNKYTKGM